MRVHSEFIKSRIAAGETNKKIKHAVKRAGKRIIALMMLDLSRLSPEGHVQQFIDQYKPRKTFEKFRHFAPIVPSYLDFYMCINNLKAPFQHCCSLFRVTNTIPEIFSN